MTQINLQLDERRAEELRRLAAERATSVAALVLEGVDLVLGRNRSDQAWAQALAVIGRHRGDGQPVAEQHDRYLEELPSPPGGITDSG